MKKLRTYKLVRGLLQASAFTSVMFIMQACYGTANSGRYEEESYQTTVNGRIVDETAQPLSGIKVMSSDLNEVVISDENGEFSINAWSYWQFDNVNLNFTDSAGVYAQVDTLVKNGSDSLNIVLAHK